MKLNEGSDHHPIHSKSISLAVSNSRKLVATACKATTVEHAVVRVYDTEKWQPVGQPLEGHSLTVTRIAFSPDDRFILSVSRDRTWRLFENQGGDGEHGTFELPLAFVVTYQPVPGRVHSYCCG